MYVPTFNALKGTDENKYVGNAMFRGDKFYYTLNEYIPEKDFTETKFMAVDINDVSKAEQIELPAFEAEDYTTRLSMIEMDTEGNLYVVYFLSPPYEEGKEIGPDDCKDILIKYDKDMNLVYQSDLKDLPNINGNVKAGPEGKLLMPGDKYLYEYDLETGIATPILDWLDSYVTADFITDYKPLDNGDFITHRVPENHLGLW